MSQGDVKRAVFKAVNERLLGRWVSWPNVNFVTPDGLWMNVSWMPGRSKQVTFGDNGEDELSGFVQIDVRDKPNTGEAAMNGIIEALEAYFTAGRVMFYNTQTVTVTSCVRTQTRVIDGWAVVYVSIYFYARYFRPSLTPLAVTVLGLPYPASVLLATGGYGDGNYSWYVDGVLQLDSFGDTFIVREDDIDSEIYAQSGGYESDPLLILELPGSTPEGAWVDPSDGSIFTSEGAVLTSNDP